MNYNDLNDFERDVFDLIEKHYPGWTDCAEFVPGVGFVVKIESPRNPKNILYISGEQDEVLVKFAVQGSHEHYECPTAEETFLAAKKHYIDPVLQNKMVAANVEYETGSRRILATIGWLSEMERKGELEVSSYETWS